MSDERAFLSTIAANPDDQTAKLAYADWLEEQNDPREEFVRLRVQVDSLADGWAAASERLAELEPTLPPKWLLQLNGPVWCVAGNIVHSRPHGPGGAETRHGTRLFKPNAKIYLADLRWGYTLFGGPLGKYDCTRVVGRHRKSLDWIACIVRTDSTTNWRVELVYQPGVLARLKEEDWPGFGLRRGAFTCPEDKTSPAAVRSLLELLGVPPGANQV